MQTEQALSPVEMIDQAVSIELARRKLIEFTLYTFPGYKINWHHRHFADILDKFIAGIVKNLIVCMPPQHGKSELATRRLPAMMLGKNPDLRVGICAYNHTFAAKFNRDIQRVIESEQYADIYPETRLSGMPNTKGNWLRNNDEFEIVNYKGSLISVGIGGGLTGNKLDIGIIDDPFKDHKEAWSAVMRENVWEWYSSVFRTRMHNRSQQLICVTRWHMDDLVGRLLKLEPDKWTTVIFPAIKVNGHNPRDKREKGEPLWPDEHNLEKLLDIKRNNEVVFESLYQQNPKPLKGLLYQSFRTYTPEDLPTKGMIRREAYIDTADTGKDYLCSIVYLTYNEALHFVLDVIYTQEPMEDTEPKVTHQLNRFAVNKAYIESNNGGRGFARNVERMLRDSGNRSTVVQWFHQSDNKQARIFSNSASVQENILFPQGWHMLFPEYHEAMTTYSARGTNQHDDAPDATTGIIEKSSQVVEFGIS